MPYKSKAQAAYMHINHPEIAKDWDEKYDSPGNLPKHVKKSKKKKKKAKGEDALEGLKRAK